MLKNHNWEPETFCGKQFPCPLCGISLAIRLSRTQKPYCVCDACGIQLFFRGKKGIRRLEELIESETLISGAEANASGAVTLYNRLRQLKAQREELERKQGIIFRDPDLDNAISLVDREIERVQAELEHSARGKRIRREE